MTLKTILFSGIVVVALVACGKSEKLPEAYGVYVWQEGKWSELAKVSKELGREVSPDTRILVYDKKVALGEMTVSMTPKGYVRNVITRNPDGSGRSISAKNVWDDAGQPPVDGQLVPVDGKQELIIFRPRAALKPGAYSISALGSELETVTVDLKSQLSMIASSEFCYDQISTKAFGIPMGVPNRFVACQGNAQDPPDELPKCAFFDVSANSDDRVKDVARRMDFGDVGMKAVHDQEMRSLDALDKNIQRDMIRFEQRVSKLLDKAAITNGALIPSHGPFKVDALTKAVCKKISASRSELFCGAGYLINQPNVEGRIAMRVQFEKGQGWKCEVYRVPVGGIPELFGSPKDAEEVEYKPWESFPSGNPYKAWGEKNRCLWDRVHANSSATCKT